MKTFKAFPGILFKVIKLYVKVFGNFYAKRKQFRLYIIITKRLL